MFYLVISHLDTQFQGAKTRMLDIYASLEANKNNLASYWDDKEQSYLSLYMGAFKVSFFILICACTIPNNSLMC